MKKLFLSAVAISALCSSCETGDDIYAEKTSHKTYTTSTHHGTNKAYDQYRNIVNSFVYDQKLDYRNNMRLFEQHVNHHIQQNTDKMLYETMDWENLQQLCYADESLIKQLDYSDAFKESLQAILQEKNASIPELTNATEKQIAATVLKMHGDYAGNGDDDKLDDKRIIAYAYGAQHSFTQAVLYAGAIELKSRFAN